MSQLEIPTAEVFVPLLQPARYKAAYGGRGSGKSHDRAAALVDDSLRIPGLRSVCIREVQKSLKDSAKRLIEDKIRAFGLGTGAGFQVFHDRIETPGDGVIIFQGMQDHNAESVKSLEGFDRAWCEEAQTMSEGSLKLLRPTIRSPGSELWFTWNPRRKLDPVDKLFRGEAGPPTNSIVVKANWDDNPWFPAELEQERQDCLEQEPEDYDHIWEGDYIRVVKGAYYSRHIGAAQQEGRIGRVAADPMFQYRAYVDIGGTGARSDAFAMWICQFVAREIRVLNYYEAQGQEIGSHLGWLRTHGYTPDNTGIWLPHDGATNDRVFSVSYESALREAGYSVTVVPNQGKGAATSRIQAARRRFPMCWFNKETTQPGLDALGWYHEKIDETRNIGLGPEHDWASHGADSFGLMAVAYQEPRAHGAPRPVVKRAMAGKESRNRSRQQPHRTRMR